MSDGNCPRPHGCIPSPEVNSQPLEEVFLWSLLHMDSNHQERDQSSIGIKWPPLNGMCSDLSLLPNGEGMALGDEVAWTVHG